MNIVNRRKKIIDELRDKEYRDAFVVEHIDTGIPFQVRTLREQDERRWTQKELGDRAGMAQESISRIEDPNYGKLTLNTLKRLASAFDIGLMVRFVPLSELVEWELNLSTESLKALSFDADPYFKEREEVRPDEELPSDNLSNQCLSPGNNVINLFNPYRREQENQVKKMLAPYDHQQELIQEPIAMEG